MNQSMNDTTSTETPLLAPGAPHVVVVGADGETLPFEAEALDRDELFVGNVLTLRGESGKRHYLIERLEADPDKDAPLKVHVVPGKSNLLKGVLLLAILAGAWFVISFATKAFFG